MEYWNHGLRSIQYSITPTLQYSKCYEGVVHADGQNFMLSQAGQKINADFGRLSGRRDIQPKYPELDMEARGVRVLLLKPEDTDQLGKQYRQLREEFLLGR